MFEMGTAPTVDSVGTDTSIGSPVFTVPIEISDRGPTSSVPLWINVSIVPYA
jgi:hypothetical protein